MAKKITKEMLKIYKPISNLDWMNYKLVKEDVTFHHIKKRMDGGKEEIENGALLMPVSHRYLHLIEYRDLSIYEALNALFMGINKQGYEPTREQREIVEYLLLKFECDHKNDKNAKGKSLIKWEYKNRGD